MATKIDYIKLKDVLELIYKLTGIRRCRATIYNWVIKGRPDYLHQNIKLKVKHRLGCLYTTEQWVVEFIEAVS